MRLFPTPHPCTAFALALLCASAGCANRSAPNAHAHHHHDTESQATPLFDDLGDHHHPITTASAEAQRYFDQGLRLIYGFNHDEAIRAFRRAAELDPACAMAHWGIGYASGPNYNLPLDDERNRVAYAATQRALSLAAGVSEKERAYINALALRYSIDPDDERKALDVAFADAMRALAAQYPEDADAATLFAESMMDLRPWDLWRADGTPNPGTEEIVATLERVLASHPNHPGANHYYVHAIEASPNPEKGLASAERLKTLVPGAGHLVHMPSHIYMRLGYWKEATEINRHAAAVDEKYIQATSPSGVYPMMYYAHNLHFMWAAASMEGRKQDALAAARRVVAQLPDDMVRTMPPMEHYTATLWFALIRFGEWKEMLQAEAPPSDLQHTLGLWHYARGIALTRMFHLDEAEEHLGALRAIEETMPSDRIVGDSTPARAVLTLAAHTLAGELAAHRGDPELALSALEAAVMEQDRLPYSEPPPWHYPTRQSLGAVLLGAGRAAQAESVFRTDLERNPDNGWSLYGLEQSLVAQARLMEASCVRERFLKAWQRADVVLTAARF